MNSLIILALGGFCLIGGFVLLYRGIGEQTSEGSFKILGVELQLSKVGPGLLFALLGVVLITLNIRNLSSAPASDAQLVTANETSTSAGPAAETSSRNGTQKPPTSGATDRPDEEVAGAGAKTQQPPVRNIAVANNGPVTTQINCVVIASGNATTPVPDLNFRNQCGLSDVEARKANLRNVDLAIDQLGQILDAREFYLIPALRSYQRYPSAAEWANVRDRALTVRRLVNEAIDSLIRLDPHSKTELGSTLRDLADSLNAKAVVMNEITGYGAGPPLSELDALIQNERTLFRNLKSELAIMRNKVAI